MSPQDDTALIARLQNRDPNALAEIYDRVGRKTFFVIFRIVREQGATEDLVQETFIKIWNSSHRIDTSQGSLLSWVMTIARNQAIDYTRSAHQRRHFQQLDEHESKSPLVEPEGKLIRADQGRRLQDSFTQLTPHQREMIELAFYQGLTHSEMAARLNKPLGTVKTWLRKAVIVLREKLTGGPLDPSF